MKKLSEKITYTGKWICLKESIFLTKRGKKITWESIERATVKDIVLLVAQLVPSGKYIMIRQYRPARGKYVIGLPAGSVDDGDIRGSAIKELKEETGYVGNIKSISPNLAINSGLTDECVYIVNMEVSEKANPHPEQELEDEEEIEVFLIEKERAKELFLEEIKKGNEVSSGVWCLFSK